VNISTVMRRKKGVNVSEDEKVENDKYYQQYNMIHAASDTHSLKRKRSSIRSNSSLDHQHNGTRNNGQSTTPVNTHNVNNQLHLDQNSTSLERKRVRVPNTRYTSPPLAGTAAAVTTSNPVRSSALSYASESDSKQLTSSSSESSSSSYTQDGSMYLSDSSASRETHQRRVRRTARRQKSASGATKVEDDIVEQQNASSSTSSSGSSMRSRRYSPSNEVENKAGTAEIYERRTLRTLSKPREGGPQVFCINCQRFLAGIEHIQCADKVPKPIPFRPKSRKDGLASTKTDEAQNSPPSNHPQESQIQPLVDCGASICFDCFSVGAEIFPHQRTHKYKVVEVLSSAIYEPHWSIDEECRMLDGLFRFGPSNWSALSKYVATKNKSECKRHYMRVFLGLHSSSKIESNSIQNHAVLGQSFREEGGLEAEHAVVDSNAEKSDVGHEAHLVSETKAETERVAAACQLDVMQVEKQRYSEPAVGAGVRDTPVPKTRGRRRKVQPFQLRRKQDPATNQTGFRSVKDETHEKPAGGSTGRAVLSGYMPKRGDFEHEWDDGAEAILAELALDDADTQEEIDLKLRLVELYLLRLDEREEKKRFILERGLLQFDRVTWEERRRPKEEKEFLMRLRAFSRLQSKEQQQELESALLHEQQTLSRMFEIAHYRSVGIRTWEQAQVYTMEQRRRVSEQQLRAAKEPLYAMSPRKTSQRGFRYLTRDLPASGPQGAWNESSLDIDGAQGASEELRPSLSTPLDTLTTEDGAQQPTDFREQSGNGLRTAPGPSDADRDRPNSTTTTAVEPGDGTNPDQADGAASCPPRIVVSISSSELADAKQADAHSNSMDWSHITVGNQLSAVEGELCGWFGLTAQRLAEAKLIAIEESSKLGFHVPSSNNATHVVRVCISPNTVESLSAVKDEMRNRSIELLQSADSNTLARCAQEETVNAEKDEKQNAPNHAEVKKENNKIELGNLKESVACREETNNRSQSLIDTIEKREEIEAKEDVLNSSKKLVKDDEMPSIKCGINVVKSCIAYCGESCKRNNKSMD